jgi:hypothetical protein
MQQPISDTLKLLLANLKARGAAKITIPYCGEGDSGAIEAPEFEPPTLRAHLAAHEVDQLTQFLESLLEPGWEIDSGSEGWVTFDFTAERITHVHSNRYTEYDTTQQSWRFAGDAVEGVTDIEAEAALCPEPTLLELPAAVSDLSGLLERTATPRTLLRLWLDFPEVESLTFQGDFEYDDEGGYLRCISLAAISFISTEARDALLSRLDGDSETRTGDPDWDELLFQGYSLDIDEDLWCEKLLRPADPAAELAALNAQLREALLTAARELGGRP